MSYPLRGKKEFDITFKPDNLLNTMTTDTNTNTNTNTTPILYHVSSGLIRATIRWNDDGSLVEDVLIKQTSDVQADEDDDIFYYGIPWAEAVQHMHNGTSPDDGDFTIVTACLEC